ncbi:unnamed protein product, partial [Amoebophrya sp. A120]|eukprot:GSA120T00021693001.1
MKATSALWFPYASGLLFAVGMLVAWSGLYHYKGTWNMERTSAFQWEVERVERTTTETTRRTHFALRKVSLNPREAYDNFEEHVDDEAAHFQAGVRPPTLLFVPGNQGSWKQMLNLHEFYLKGSFTGAVHFFSLDFAEQPTAFSAHILRNQAEFLRASVVKLTDRRTRWGEEHEQHLRGERGEKVKQATRSRRNHSLVLVAHSMGYLVAKHALYLYPALRKRVDYVFCISCVQRFHPFLFLDAKLARLAEEEVVPDEAVKVLGVSSGARDELLSPEFTCRADGSIIPTITMKNVYNDQTHVSLLFSRPVLHRLGSVSLPQLHRPRRKSASKKGSSTTSTSSTEQQDEDAQSSSKAGDVSISTDDVDQGYADALDSLRSPFFRLNSLFAEVGNARGGLRKELLDTHQLYELDVALPEAKSLREGRAVLRLETDLARLFRPARMKHLAEETTGKKTSSSTTSRTTIRGRDTDNSADARPPLYEWEVPHSEEPFVLVLQKDFNSGPAGRFRHSKHAGGEPFDRFDAEDVIQCHDEVKVYARYFEVSEATKKKGPQYRPHKRSDFSEVWSQIMPVGSVSHPQKLCVYLVRNSVVGQQPDGTKPTGKGKAGDSPPRTGKRIARTTLEFDPSRLVAIGPGDAFFATQETKARNNSRGKKRAVETNDEQLFHLSDDGHDVGREDHEDFGGKIDEEVEDGRGEVNMKGSAKISAAASSASNPSKFQIRGFAAHRETWGLNRLRSLTLWDWVSSLVVPLEVIPADSTSLFTWVVLSKDELDYELFSFDFFTAASEQPQELDHATSSAASSDFGAGQGPLDDATSEGLGLAWDSSGDLASVGRLGSAGTAGLTKSSWRNNLGLLDAESHPRVWSPRFS